MKINYKMVANQTLPACVDATHKDYGILITLEQRLGDKKWVLSTDLAALGLPDTKSLFDDDYYGAVTALQRKANLIDEYIFALNKAKELEEQYKKQKQNVGILTANIAYDGIKQTVHYEEDRQKQLRARTIIPNALTIKAMEESREIMKAKK